MIEGNCGTLPYRVKIGPMAKRTAPPMPDSIKEYFREQGRIGGRKGSKARMTKLTPEQRSAIAKHAVQAREAKRKKTKAEKKRREGGKS